MKLLKPYIFIVILVIGCSHAIDISEHEEQAASVHKDIMLISKVSIAYYIVNDEWPVSFEQIQVFLNNEAVRDQKLEEEISEYLILLDKVKHFKIQTIANDRISINLTTNDNIDFKISLIIEKEHRVETIEYLVNLNAEAHHKEGSIDKTQKYVTYTNPYSDPGAMIIYTTLEILLNK